MQNNMPMQQSWHHLYANNDRQRIVQIITLTLRDIQGNRFDSARALAIAQEFEKLTFRNSQSREQYLKLIKLKIQQLKQNMPNPQVQNQQNQQNQQQNSQQMHQQQQNQMQQQNQLQNPQNNANPMMNMQMNKMAMNSNLSQQNNQATNMNNRFRNNSSVGNNNNNNNNNAPKTNATPTQANRMLNQPMNIDVPLNNLSVQQQQQGNAQTMQISQLIRNSPIPPTLLAKLPNLPPNVNTWQQIFDLASSRMLPTTTLSMIKDVHHTHLQLAIRQQQMRQAQQAQLQQPQQQVPQQVQQQQMRQPSQLQQPQVQHQQQQHQQQLQQQLRQPPQQVHQNIPTGINQQNMAQNLNLNNNVNNAMMNNQAQSNPNVSANTINGSNNQTPQPPQFQITQQDYLRYSQDALALLSRIQQSKNVTADAQQKDNFIRKFIIHQKTQLWRQQMGLPTSSNSNNSINNNNSQNNAPRNVPPNSFNNNANANANVGFNNNANNVVNPTNSNASNAPPIARMPYNSMLPTLSQSPQLQQRMINTPQLNNTSATMNPTPVPNNNINNAPNTANNANSNAVNINAMNFNQILPPPTEEMKAKLRQLIEEVSRNNNVLLKDQTNSLSAMDKNMVRESIVRISQQYAGVDKIISYFYLLTRNAEGTRRLIQMKYMTKNILESSARNVYLAGPDLLEKLRVQYQKYFDYVKDQFQIRRQNMQNQAGQQANHNQNQNLGQGQLGIPPQPPMEQPMQDQQQRPQMIQNNQQFTPQINMNMGMPQQPQQIPPNQSQIPVPRSGPVPGVPQPFPQPVAGDNQWQMSQRNNAISSSPMMPQNMSPIMVNHQSPPQSSAKPPAKPAATPNKKPSVSGSRRRTSTKGPINVNSIPTPAGGSVATPGSLAIKTPNSMPTPQVQSHSNKNTPQAQSPSYHAKAAPSDSIVTTDIFTSDGDSKLVRRRDLSNSDPEKFFYAALANLLELEEPSDKGAITGIYTPQPTPQLANGNLSSSPFSPLREWNCEINHEAITSSFRQVDSIREMVSNDIIDDCSQLFGEDTKQDIMKGIKRSSSVTENEIDTLFGEKKPRVCEDDYKYVYEPIAFDEWKQFIISGTQ